MVFILHKTMKLGILMLVLGSWSGKCILNEKLLENIVFKVYNILMGKYSSNSFRQANPFIWLVC